jgi:type IV secretion system protein TrbG
VGKGQVYSDGIKTYIQFPPAMRHDEAPALVAIGADDREQLVNYRLSSDRYVVDKVLRRAALIAGVGSDQVKVEILRDARAP